jgi:pimeloyl-ACP methyl ester carboxylesterase
MSSVDVAANPFSAKSFLPVAISLLRVVSLRSACVGTDLLYQGFTNRQLVYNIHPMTTPPPTTNEERTSTAAATTVLARKTAEVDGQRIAYVDTGDGDAPVALFVHGVLVNADLWRNVIFDVADLRRCIAPDLPAHGASPIPGAGADVSLTGLAHMLNRLCDELEVDQVDVVANDTGGAIAQVFAARYPQRIRTLTLTNCDVHDNFPPEAFKPFMEMAFAGEFGPAVAAMAGDRDLAREVGLSTGYVQAGQLSDEVVDSYLMPFVADQGKGLERVLTAASPDELTGIAPLLAELHAPTQVAWGTADIFFGPEWAERLRELIPGVERITLVPDAMLFWVDERAADLVPLLRDFWHEHA